MNKKLGLMVGALFALTAAQGAMAACNDIARTDLQNAANAALESGDAGGFHLNMWVTFVDETGMVCQVVNTGGSDKNGGSGDQWLGSRIISAQKANTANAFSLDSLSIPTAALYGPSQTGGTLFGLQHSNPVDASRSYGGSPNGYGTNSDYLKNKRIGGVNVFGGGLAVYKNGVKVGAIGVSGDTSCADHSFAWLVRSDLGLEPNPLNEVSVSTFNNNNWVGNTETDLGRHPFCDVDFSTVGWLVPL